MAAIRSRKTILRKNSAGSEFSRRRMNLIEGSGITLTVADDAANNETDVTIAASGSSSDGLATVHMVDDFISGSVTGSGTTGRLNWLNSNGGSNAAVAGEADHPGIIRMSAASAQSTIYLRITSGTGSFLPAEDFDLTWIIRPTQVDADTGIRLGLAADSLAAFGTKPANGLYFEFLLGGTNWLRTARASSVETATAVDTGVAVAAATWYKLRIRRIDGSTIGYTINAGSEQTLTANIPTAALTPFANIFANVAGPKTMDVDYFSLDISGITR
jgi:hypothetical protein